ncbi:hypothetical protein ACH5RR_003168 [Cinchona calisaya]|uniref:Aminotransferase-like plant mobile domain-containing protein n=1 Tax=Cinchona calisaya TaxID=153742 RepID=A0ABD3AU18_9GENT
MTIFELLSSTRMGTSSFPTLLGRMQADNITWASRSFNIFGPSLTHSMSWIFWALLDRWSPGTNTFHTFYGKIGIPLLDIQKIGGLPSSGEFYDECNPSNKMLGSKHIPQATIDLYDLILALSTKPTFQAWMANFIILVPNHPNSNAEVHPYVLTYRMGDNLIAEPYESRRFGHQFGYGQHCPQNVDTRYQDGLSLIALFQYWQRMHHYNTGARLITGIANGSGLLDHFTKNLSVDFIRSGKTANPRQSKGMLSSLVEDGFSRSVEFPSNESFSQHGPTSFSSLDDLESFMSLLPSIEAIHNLFNNGIFVKGSGFLQTKESKRRRDFLAV